MKKLLIFSFLSLLFLFGLLKVSQIYWRKNFKFNFFNSPSTFIFPTPTSTLKVKPKITFINPARFELEFRKSGLKYTFPFRKNKQFLGSCRLAKAGNEWYVSLVLTNLPVLGKGFSYYLWLKTEEGNILPLEHLYYQPQTKKAEIYLNFVNKKTFHPSECLVSRESKEKPAYPFEVVCKSISR